MRRFLFAAAIAAAASVPSGASAVDIANCASVNPGSGWVGSVNRCVFGTGSRCIQYTGLTVTVNSVNGCIN